MLGEVEGSAAADGTASCCAGDRLGLLLELAAVEGIEVTDDRCYQEIWASSDLIRHIGRMPLSATGLGYTDMLCSRDVNLTSPKSDQSLEEEDGQLCSCQAVPHPVGNTYSRSVQHRAAASIKGQAESYPKDQL